MQNNVVGSHIDIVIENFQLSTLVDMGMKM